MAKSAGNFLTLEDGIQTYTADGTRIGLADAGDSLDDANFQKETANAALMRLYLLDQFVEERLSGTLPLRGNDSPKTWADRAFENELIDLVHQARAAYDRMAFRDALKACFFDFGTARDQYRNLCGTQNMRADAVDLWIETQAVILCPIAPHITESIWSLKLKKKGLVIDQPWPTFADRPYDSLLYRELETLFDSLEEFRRAKDKGKPGSGKGAAIGDAAVIYVARDYLPWQQVVLRLLQRIPLDETGRAPQGPGFMSQIKSHPDILGLDKKLIKDAMSFASFRMKVCPKERRGAIFFI